MIRIIKDSREKHFVCQACGCDYIADGRSYFKVQYSCGSDYECNCPNCTVVNKEIIPQTRLA